MNLKRLSLSQKKVVSPKAIKGQALEPMRKEGRKRKKTQSVKIRRLKKVHYKELSWDPQRLPRCVAQLR